MADRRVVITGLGMVSPLGLNLRESWEGLCEGRSGIGPVTQLDATAYPSRIAGEVRGFNPENYVEPKAVKRYDRFSLFAIATAREAWADSGLSVETLDPTRIGTILGVGIGGLKYLEDNHAALLEGGPRKLSPFLIPAMISNLAPGNVAIDLGFKGINYTITSACTSGTHAVGEAYRMIKDGLQDIIMTGGAEAAITQLGLGGFGKMKALSTRNDEPTKASRPFDRDRDGFVIGEGSGSLVLEEYESARKRGAKIYAEVAGYGFSCDAYHITGQLEGGEGAVQCMNMALNFARMNPEDIDYINAHGTSTPLNDPNESLAIKKSFGAWAKEGLMVSSTKSMVGHLLGAAGGLEAVVIAKAIEEGCVPPTINLDNPDEGCDLDYVPHTARRKAVRSAMSNSFGFGGTNAAVIFKTV
ncbi:MAG TPA: beta-ketoacyl-ACP synthase II [Oligoflexia bacterium]|nr:beta-ketoacyl-ACP synthase II [Oligoflexia bacterium]HMP47037.1 beta-ketoacyl-ACP synthase II [Oligoflexia bacterium]